MELENLYKFHFLLELDMLLLINCTVVDSLILIAQFYDNFDFAILTKIYSVSIKRNLSF